MNKKWYESSTLWINLSAIVLVGLDFVLQDGTISNPDVIAIVAALANIIRRLQIKPNEKIGAIEKAVI